MSGAGQNPSQSAAKDHHLTEMPPKWRTEEEQAARAQKLKQLIAQKKIDLANALAAAAVATKQSEQHIAEQAGLDIRHLKLDNKLSAMESQEKEIISMVYQVSAPAYERGSVRASDRRVFTEATLALLGRLDRELGIKPPADHDRFIRDALAWEPHATLPADHAQNVVCIMGGLVSGYMKSNVHKKSLFSMSETCVKRCERSKVATLRS